MSAKIAILVGILISAGFFTSAQYQSSETMPRESSWFESYETTTERTTNTQLLIANTPELRVQGLSNTPALPADTGMLFIFQNPDTYGIWMKDMNYAIDVLWLNENKEIVYLFDNMSPQSYPETFRPDNPALYIIEYDMNFIESNNMQIGQQLDFDDILFNS